MAMTSAARLRRAGAASVAVAAGLTLAGCTGGSSNPSGSVTISTAAGPTIISPAPQIVLPSGPASSSPASPAAPTTGAAARVVGAGGACTGDQIRQSTQSLGAALGHRGDVLVFTNTSASTCTMSGYPGATVSYSNGGHWDAARVLFGYMGGAQGETAPPTVTLAPGAAASSVLMWTAVDDTSAACQNSNYTELLTTTPNTQSTVTYQGTFSCENLQVTPVVPGTTGQTQP
jgi:Protein of unknown function (DUF4232)